VVALCIVLLAVTGCRTHRERDEKKASPDVLYKRARHISIRTTSTPPSNL